MEHRQPARTALVVPALAPASRVVRCVQCGEVLDAQHVRQLTARVEKALCADCSFDLPCTD
jgi:formylmethanofuran dehydrogenase subunit E